MAVIRINEIIERLQAYHPQADAAVVQKAYVRSAMLHAGQLRLSGLPYLSHPLEVAGILTELKLHESAVAAGLLHDVVEDTIVTPAELEAEFGKEITRLVEGVTKIGKVTAGATRIEIRAENYRKMILAMAQDVRVILIKLADRLHNMRTLNFHDEDRRISIARETFEIYAPIAGRLGIHWIQAELEDLCLRYSKPEIYMRLASRVAQVRDARQEYIAMIQDELGQHLSEAGIEASVSGRFKHLSSVYRKMETQKLAFEEVHDLLAFRIIVPSINACYDALRVIHSMWKPVPKRIKDYIALPKANMYRSLHTTVIGPEGTRVEIQIRTPEMHALAEHGIAAHWRYKQAGAMPGPADEKKTLEFVSQLVEFQEELKDPNRFLETLKSGLVPDEIMVFTPAGDMIELAAGATPIDLAYAIHTDLGNRCGGARVNGKMVGLNAPLSSGDTVEIISSPTVEPAKAWLDLVTTPRARTKITHWLSLRESERAREVGRQLLEAELLRYDRGLGQLLESGEIKEVARRYSFLSANRLFEAVGLGKFPAQKVLARLVDPDELRSRAKTPAKAAGKKKAGVKAAGAKKAGKAAKKKPARPDQPSRPDQPARPDQPPPDEDSFPEAPVPAVVAVAGLMDPVLPLAACCNPIPGDEITAVPGEGDIIRVHRQGCPEVRKARTDNIFPAKWSDQIKELALAAIEIFAEDRAGMLLKITAAISDAKINIVRAVVHTTDDRKAQLTFHVRVKNLSQLRRVQKAIEKIDGVISVSRP